MELDRGDGVGGAVITKHHLLVERRRDDLRRPVRLRERGTGMREGRGGESIVFITPGGCRLCFYLSSDVIIICSIISTPFLFNNLFLDFRMMHERMEKGGRKKTMAYSGQNNADECLAVFRFPGECKASKQENNVMSYQWGEIDASVL